MDTRDEATVQAMAVAMWAIATSDNPDVARYDRPNCQTQEVGCHHEIRTDHSNGSAR